MTLTTRNTLGGLPQQLHLSARDLGMPNTPTRTMAIAGSLHDDVLLEIFDFYRQSFQRQPNSERIWNNKNGWFKLAHVCHNWRSVVLASPRRLRLRLYFAHDTPTRAAALQSLSHLPIVVDYTEVTWNANVLRCLISALRYPDRVCRIAIKGSYKNEHSLIIIKALELSFPALESLELHNLGRFAATILSSSPFRTSIQSLRHLQLNEYDPSPILSQVLSVTTSLALVDLTLNVFTILDLLDRTSIFPHLQCLPHLRNLQVVDSMQLFVPIEDEMVPSPPTTTTVLPELTHFCLSAGCSGIEWFVAGLVAPTLRGLHISIRDAPLILHPNLSELIRVAGIVFFAAQFMISRHTLATSLLVDSNGDPPSKIVTIETPSLVQLDSALFATVEDIFLSLSEPFRLDNPFTRKRLHKQFRKEFRNVKVLRLHHGLETIVAGILRQPTANHLSAGEEVDPDATASSSAPIDHGGSQFTFPSLEEIVVYARTPNMSFDEKKVGSVLESFGPFTTARLRVGRPVKVFWNTYGKVPRYFNP